MMHVEQLSFTYGGAPGPAIQNVSFAVEEGEIFGFLGPSGAGKSTTQNLLIGLLSGYQGSIQVLGREMTDWGPGYYEHIGVCFELPNHYPDLTALENLQYFRGLYRGSTEEPLEVLAWLGLEAHAHRRVREFSKGMKVRLNFARSLLPKPRLLFLDEVTNGLDPVNSRRVRSLVKERQRSGSTVFLTTHDMMVATELCDRVAFIVDGRLAAVGAPRDLMEQYGERRVQVEVRDGQGLQEASFDLDGLHDNSAFQDLLRQGSVERVHSQESTLEDVFLQVTGRSLSGSPS